MFVVSYHAYVRTSSSKSATLLHALKYAVVELIALVPIHSVGVV